METLKNIFAIFVITMGTMFIFGFVFSGLSKLHKESSADFEAQYEKKVQYEILLKPASQHYKKSHIFKVEYASFGDSMIKIKYNGKTLLIPYCSIECIREK